MTAAGAAGPPASSAASIAGPSRSVSRFRVRGSTSTSTGLAPTCSMTWAVEQKVIGVVKTRWPGPTPPATRARCSAAVPELSARAAAPPVTAANSSSNRCARGPVVSQPDRRTSTTSAISSSPMNGSAKGSSVSRAP